MHWESILWLREPISVDWLGFISSSLFQWMLIAMSVPVHKQIHKRLDINYLHWEREEDAGK
jgi:hypothetical protein